MDYSSVFYLFCNTWMVAMSIACVLSVAIGVLCRIAVWNKSRIQYIEIHDQHWSPVIFQQFVRRILYSGAYRGIAKAAVKECAAKIESIVNKHDISIILDLCSGTCGPSYDINKLINANKTTNDSKIISILTDLFPQSTSWKVLASQNPNLAYSEKPVDATNIDLEHIHDIIAQHTGVSVDNTKPKIRTLAGAFHHFTPDLCESIFKNAMENGDIMVVMDGYADKTFKNMFVLGVLHILILIYGLPALFKFYLFEEPGTSLVQAIYKVLVTIIFFPVFLVAFAHDAFVSFARTYTPKQLTNIAQNALAKLDDASIEYSIQSQDAKLGQIFICQPQ